MASYLPISQDALKTILIEAKVIRDKDWQEAQKSAHHRQRNVDDVLIEHGFFNERYLYELIGASIKASYVNLRKRKLEQATLNELSRDVVEAAKAIPFLVEGNILKVAFVNPVDKANIDLVKKSTAKKVEAYLTSYRNFRFAARLYEKDIKEKLEKILHAKNLAKNKDKDEMDISIINIIDAIMEYSIFEQASDIHIEALPNSVVVRFRIDGDLHDKIELPGSVHGAIVARIKILSNLRIDEHRIPQDGRFSFKVGEEEESVRVSVIPAFYGEKVVMRLLTDEAQNYNLEDIGFSEHNIKMMTPQLKKPFGMILVVGPTGSGKTTTLYTILNILNTEEVNICTIEDPIEYGINRVNQTQVNPKAGYDFANGLRALLRQDPDIIMIGEIRDTDTARIAVRAGLTGHLVLSTLHTNNAAGAPPRLLDMKVESFLVASTLNVVIAQRLVRKICSSCIESFRLSKEEIKSLSKEFDLSHMLQRFKELNLIDESVTSFADLTFYRGKGCTQCDNTGYAKRTAVMEVLENTERIQALIIKNASSGELHKAAMEEGMINIFEDGMQKVLLGVTTIEEVLRIKRE